MWLAHRNLLQDRTRLFLSIAGVSLSVVLILLLNSFVTGMFRQIAAYLDGSPASLVVAQDGVNNLLGATSLLPDGTLRRVRRVDGVAKAIPILSQFVILDLHGKKQPAYLIGYDASLGGGPARFAAGRTPTHDDEIIFDRILARRHSLGLGSRVEIMDRTFTIVGLSDGTTSWMTSFLFITRRAAERLLGAPGGTSFVLVEVAPGMAPQTVRDRLIAVRGTSILLKSEMIANDNKLFGKVFSAPLRLMSGIGFLVGSLVVGMVIYTATIERRREYGVLKAIGARNGLLYRVVTTQAVIAAGSGSLLGLIATIGLAKWIMIVRPQFLLVLDPRAAAISLLAGFGMALAGALFPVRIVAALAPAEVFRK